MLAVDHSHEESSEPEPSAYAWRAEHIRGSRYATPAQLLTVMPTHSSKTARSDPTSEPHSKAKMT